MKNISASLPPQAFPTTKSVSALMLGTNSTGHTTFERLQARFPVYSSNVGNAVE